MKVRLDDVALHRIEAAAQGSDSRRFVVHPVDTLLLVEEVRRLRNALYQIKDMELPIGSSLDHPLHKAQKIAYEALNHP